MFLFKRKQAPVIGLDISSTSVKLLELSRAGGGYRVDSHAVEPLPASAINEKSIADVDAVGQSISKALKRAGVKNKNCAMAVPGSAVITKTITMPASLSDEELEGQVQLEADQYIPYALDEVNLDFEVIGASEGSAETVDVLLAASRSENVELRVAAAEAAGLVPKVMEVEAYAVENAFPCLSDQMPDGGRDKTIGVIDIGATMTSLDVMINGKMVYTREQPFGGKQLTEEIMRRYSLSYDEAGRAKKQGGLPEGYEQEVFEPFKETVAQQVNRFLQFFYSATQHASVDHLILAGGTSCMPGLDKLIEARLGVATSIANPFNQMAIGARVNPQALGGDAPSLMIACGLALRSFDA